ncbi:MAG TPA: hypothetical protein PLQ13_07760 [Candidatus Krumholzibacteria bacterium]|nr:hypothetical protein [Candidatus Krumholzibacteria bacterium]
MDWNATARFLQGQGPVFWAAALAVALGCTLVVAAGLLQVRRRVAARRPAAPTVRLTGTGYAATPSPAPLAPPAPPTAAADPRLPELHRRLAAAAARLETLRSERTAGVSGLKSPIDRVEYLHRSGRA